MMSGVGGGWIVVVGMRAFRQFSGLGGAAVTVGSVRLGAGLPVDILPDHSPTLTACIAPKLGQLVLDFLSVSGGDTGIDGYA